MFAYCLNNPVNYEDSDGEMAAAAGALAWGVAAGGANAWNPAEWIKQRFEMRKVDMFTGLRHM